MDPFCLRVRLLHVAWSISDGDDLYCVLSTGTARFTAKSPLPGISKGGAVVVGSANLGTGRAASSLDSITGSAAPSEAFLISPRDLKHAAVRTLQPSSNLNSSSIQGSFMTSSAAMAADASGLLGLLPASATAARSSPMLLVELYSSKRWGADALVASGELLLLPALAALQQQQQQQQQRAVLEQVQLQVLKRSSGSSNKASKVAPALAGTSDNSSSVLLELAALAPPSAPVQLLGPVGSGRAEVPPIHSCNASWLSPWCPVLQTSGGQLCQSPSVQCWKVTLHKAQGLQNLHVDPQAAAAAAAVMHRLTSRKTAGSTMKADRSQAAAVQDGSQAAKGLLLKGGSWFQRRTRPPAATKATMAAAVAVNSAAKSQAAAATAATAVPAAVDASNDLCSSRSSMEASGSVEEATTEPAAAGTDQAAAPVTAGADTALATAVVIGSGRSSMDKQDYYAQPGFEATAASVAFEETALVPGAADSSSTCSSAPGAEDPDQVFAASTTTAAAAADVATPLANSSNSSRKLHLADPVSLLKDLRQQVHGRTVSFDTETVMSALEENGFHATDAPGGAFFYARVGLGSSDGGSIAGGSSSSVSSGSNTSSSSDSYTRVVGLGSVGEAVWEQAFWFTTMRPAAAAAALEVELFAAKDDKTRGKSVTSIKVPLHQLVQDLRLTSSKTSSISSSDGSPYQWLWTTQELQASFSDHLHCTISITVELADWDLRAEYAGMPRVLLPSSWPAAAAAAEVFPTQQQQQPLQPSSSAHYLRQPAPADDAVNSSGRGSSRTMPACDTMGTATAAVDAAAGGRGQPPSVADLDVVVKAFDTRKSVDAFFVLLLGSYCLVSSTSHSSHHHSWGWHVRLPLQQPSDILTLALFAREDQSGGKKRVGASMLTMFSGSIKLLGKMRVRCSTLSPNVPLNLTMPLQGERTNLRPGAASAAVCHLYCHLMVPQLLGSYLRSYVSYSTCSPALYLLLAATAARKGTTAADVSTVEELEPEVQLTSARWLEGQLPLLPFKALRKVQDDGRSEFTLSRTRSNWRRLILLREGLAPAAAAFQHLCLWESYRDSCCCYCVILMFGLWPSKVLAGLLLLFAAHLIRNGWQQGGASSPPISGASTGGSTSRPSTPMTSATAATLVVAPPAAPAAAKNRSLAAAGWRLPLQPRPPPAMSDPLSLAAADEQQGSVVPTDPYTALKQNYEGVVQFLTTVQNVLDSWACTGERLQLAFGWTDQLATLVLLLLLVLLAVGLWFLGLRVLVTVGLLWVFRHPILRDPLPPPPFNFVSRMPTRADTML